MCGWAWAAYCASHAVVARSHTSSLKALATALASEPNEGAAKKVHAAARCSADAVTSAARERQLESSSRPQAAQLAGEMSTSESRSLDASA